MAPPRHTLADRLADRAARIVVGRDAERELFDRLLASPLPPVALLWFHGPGGIGKSTLLAQLRERAEAGGRLTALVDAQLLEPAPAAFETQLGAADPRLAAEPGVLFIDTAERLTPLVGWLRREFLPAVPASWLVVAAGRDPPPVEWATDAAWHALLQVRPLPPLVDDEARALLRHRGVAEGAVAPLLARARGHPLALALMADVAAAAPGDEGLAASWGDGQPALVQTLVQRFTRGIDPARLGRALAVAALARHTTLALLGDVLGDDQAAPAFEALRGLSFMQTRARGLAPHELVRDVLVADLRWRDPDAMRGLLRTMIRHHYRRMVTTTGADRIHHQSEALYTQRHAGHKSRFFAWDELGLHRVAPAREADAALLRAMVRRHEGEGALPMFEHWWRHQREGFRLFWRGDGDERCDGFLLLLRLGPHAAPQHLKDPAVAAAWRLVQAVRPLGPADELVLLRHWMQAERYQAVTAAINLTSMHVVSHLIGDPSAAWSVVWMADPGFWQPHFDGVNFARCPAADYAVGDRRHGAFVHDWRLEPPDDWMAGDHRPMPFAGATTTEASPLAASASDALEPGGLPGPAWLQQVRQALADAADPAALARGRLARHLGLDGPGLQAVLREGVRQLGAHPRDAKFRDALWLTFIEPRVKQEQVAAELGIPFPTYRYRLRQGIERLAAALATHRGDGLPPSDPG